MTDLPLLDDDGHALPLPPDPLSPIPDIVERELAAYRAGEAQQARAALTTIAESGRTAVAGHAAMALAGIELADDGLSTSCEKWLEQVARGEDPWLGPLAVVMLSADFKAHAAAPEPLLGHLAKQLTGDLAAARKSYEHALAELRGTSARFDEDEINGEYDDDFARIVYAQQYIANILLGNLLLQSGNSAAALEPLNDARLGGDGLLAAYAAYLEGHVLVEQKDAEKAARVLGYAFTESLPHKSGTEGELLPWTAIRYCEALASNPWMDEVAGNARRSAVDAGTVILAPFETATSYMRSSKPALIDVGYGVFPGDWEPVYPALGRLRAWSDERYERARRLILVLHEFVEDQRNEEQTRNLAELRKKLDLPDPR
ncbi:hypothetical protein SAMN05421805_12547 [Saccharopolyspora antimicrobica]|uniref:Uncharacterized protein n=2 Tax=Saccharopolyspora antimicrobica TaxID=455193 RepID=A0A1I5K420_9PSEU|nr:hypothetical protein ATL45_3113 [Saccharopolyspora antimicrobica]SFO79750.1 hypothetical protein SAMN05421805_12547 [Saccharopolyspora antimicrobica]